MSKLIGSDAAAVAWVLDQFFGANPGEDEFHVYGEDCRYEITRVALEAMLPEGPR